MSRAPRSEQPRDLRVGLVGCGVMGEHYARVVSEAPSVVLAAVCDVDEARAADFGARTGPSAPTGITVKCSRAALMR